MSSAGPSPPVAPASQLVQVYRRDDGSFAHKPDRAPLRAGEMLIGRGLSLDEASELTEEFNAAALGLRPSPAAANGEG
jgi:hypothetical protein